MEVLLQHKLRRIKRGGEGDKLINQSDKLVMISDHTANSLPFTSVK